MFNDQLKIVSIKNKIKIVYIRNDKIQRYLVNILDLLSIHILVVNVK